MSLEVLKKNQQSEEVCNFNQGNEEVAHRNQAPEVKASNHQAPREGVNIPRVPTEEVDVRPLKVRGLVDSGVQVNIISQKLFKRLGLGLTSWTPAKAISIVNNSNDDLDLGDTPYVFDAPEYKENRGPPLLERENDAMANGTTSQATTIVPNQSEGRHPKE